MEQEEVGKIVEEVLKHMAGKHDQSTHGRGGSLGSKGRGSSISSVASRFGLKKMDVDEDIGSIKDYHTFKQFRHIQSGDSITVGQYDSGGEYEVVRYGKDTDSSSSNESLEDALKDVGLVEIRKSD